MPGYMPQLPRQGLAEGKMRLLLVAVFYEGGVFKSLFGKPVIVIPPDFFNNYDLFDAERGLNIPSDHFVLVVSDFIRAQWLDHSRNFTSVFSDISSFFVSKFHAVR